MPTFQLEIVTPEKTLYSGTVEHVRAPGIDGGFGVLSGHHPMVSALGIGQLRIREEGGDERMAAVNGGFAEVISDQLTVLAETAELADSIDRTRAEEARDRARDRLKTRRDPEVDIERAEAALARAINRLRVHG
ncbi:MAG: ATP synthase F1 subunit epsilon [Gemmatimonadetes bacterium]|jgi:F-type H+-transporting ATPase subunit epsilon|nr:ATP synthase F1 subunit epsilon [Gemmatimonadota bacterium]HCK11713.1 F0F1 ATP synthase subunit epsilon [Candidatus Latescibacterota bacterium]